MDKRRTVTWFIRGFTWTGLVLILVTLVWPASGQVQERGRIVGGEVEENAPSLLLIPAAAFSSDGGFPDGFFFDFEYGYIRGDEFGCLKAPVTLPDGASVVAVNAYLYDNADNKIVLNLRRVSLTSGVQEVLAEVETVENSTAIQFLSDTSIANPVISYPDYAYYLTTCLDSTSKRLFAVSIAYTEP